MLKNKYLLYLCFNMGESFIVFIYICNSNKIQYVGFIKHEKKNKKKIIIQLGFDFIYG
jgi:hypothetical protein